MGKKKFFISIILLACIGLSFVIYIILNKQKPCFPNITIGTSLSINAALLAIADEKKFFKQQGLNVKIKYYPSAAVAFNDMLNGNINIAGVSETPIAYKCFNRNDFKIFAIACTTSNDPKIIARTESNIKKPYDLVGKKIGSTKKGQSAHFFLHLFLLKYGITYENITIIHDSPSKIVEKLTLGDIDAASLFEPYASYAAKKLKNEGLIFSEPSIYYKSFNLTAKTKFLKQNQKAVKNLIYSLIKAEKYALQYPEKCVEFISKKYLIDRQIVKNYLDFSTLDISLSDPLVLALHDQAKWAVQNHLIENKKIPIYTNFLHINALKSVRPESVIITK